MKEDFDHIKKRLRDYESPIQLDEAWEALQTQQQKRQDKWKRTSVVLLLLLLIGSCGTCWLLGKRSGMYMQTPMQEEASLHIRMPAEQGSQALESKTTRPKYNIVDTNHESTTLTQTNTHTTTLSPITNNPAPPASHSSETPVLFIPEHQNQPSNSSENTQKASTSNNDLLSIFPPVPAAAPVYGPSIDSGNTSSAVTPENDRSDSDSPLLQSTAGNASTWMTSIPPAAALQHLWWMEALPEKTPGMIARPSRLSLSLPVMKIALSPIRPARKTPIRKTISLSAGTVLAQQSFKSRTTEQAEYAALRSRTESGLPGLSTDLGISLEVSKRNYVDLALRYDMWYDQFVYQYEQSKAYTLTNVLLGVVQYEPIGTQVRVYGDTIIAGSQTVKATYYNRYTAADLRLAFGRTLWFSRRFSLDLTAGMSANIYKKMQGHIADSGLANSVMELQHMPYKQTLGLGVYADLRLNYRLTSWLDIQLRPSATLGLSDALQGSAPSSARFRRTSLQLGLRTRF